MEPYDDFQTGKRALALGKTLRDGYSVVAINVQMDSIQQMIAESVAEGESDMQMIISKYGIIIAHTEEDEIGKNYYLELERGGGRRLFRA